MKTLIITLFIFSQSAFALTITPAAKGLVFDAIANTVYAENDEGAVRAPQSVSDFQFDIVSAEQLLVTGQSFSAMDNKVIGYSCTIEILGRDIIESEYDFEVTDCQLSL